MAQPQYNRNPNKIFPEDRRVNPNTFLPSVGQFKQNQDRPEDLEMEERAIMNMYAQDFDDLKLLDMLATNEELYQHKLKQYKQISDSRIQAEKVLQEQRLEKYVLYIYSLGYVIILANKHTKMNVKSS